MDIRILDLDGTLPAQPPIARRLAEGKARRHDLTALGPKLRLWSRSRDYDAFADGWRDLAEGSSPTLTLFGSGDFHHLTAAFIEAAAGPLTVVHFDNHPDWCRTFPRRHCGGWVNEALAMPHVRRVITLGPCSEDLVRPDRKGANLAALSEGSLVVLPWRHEPSQIRVPVAAGKGHEVGDGEIRWRNLCAQDWGGVLDDLLSAIPTRRVWITIDKDVLGPDEALTNWDQGELPLACVEAAIRHLARECEIVGADICGDYNPAPYRQPFKSLEAFLDQRDRPRGGDAAAINARTNERLIATFEECFA
ncbi:arginase [Ancylobacter sp. 6x-1]|uniref:Arginase n=1 Tax=Ancylobacter crimeensis TaxID=2579147 RepID=A0ABT0D9V3_9HYPH|nr:arginase [Ancylobacter crimeensis]MCK0196738.1 arginase [Ancylobacter crimeensis]